MPITSVANSPVFLDCTLRDGGYYNAWDFPEPLIHEYLDAMSAAGVDVVELGLRSLKNAGFKGACAFTTDAFLGGLSIPEDLTVGVMVNACELVGEQPLAFTLEQLFPAPARESPVSLVRVACHGHEFSRALPAASWLKERGYRVGFNLMQITNFSEHDLKALAREAAGYPLDTLYFADSMGSMQPRQTGEIIRWLRSGWQGQLGIHTHDNLRLALANTLHALDEGVTWVDATVTGMGRGPGNSRTEELAIEMAQRRGGTVNLVPLMTLVREYFKPLQNQEGWGTNPYYYLAGKYGIHPTYIQHMLADARFDPEDILSVIDHLRDESRKSFSSNRLEMARHFYASEPAGSWDPATELADRDVLIIGAGPGARLHRHAIEGFIRRKAPLVVALNTQQAIDESLICYRAACHPIRLLADVPAHRLLAAPLITPLSMLPGEIRNALESKAVRDYGLQIRPEEFAPGQYHATLPSSLVIAYALAIASRGRARKVYMAGFDGYGPGDPRTEEVKQILRAYSAATTSPELVSVTPTEYPVATQSIYSPTLD
ncbi:MAG: aldolase [Halomonadaceae bacterium]|nr:MAG: aldolase [Halomonadaceae bacterium]